MKHLSKNVSISAQLCLELFSSLKYSSSSLASLRFEGRTVLFFRGVQQPQTSAATFSIHRSLATVYHAKIFLRWFLSLCLSTKTFVESISNEIRDIFVLLLVSFHDLFKFCLWSTTVSGKSEERRLIMGAGQGRYPDPNSKF